METTFRIDYSESNTTAPPDYLATFQRLSEMLCQECGGGCQGFFLTSSIREYQACRGPKIGWAVEEGRLLLRMANCKDVGRVERITQFLRHFGLTVVESRQIQ